MEIDRKLQFEILIYLKSHYPKKLSHKNWIPLQELASETHLIGNMIYLEEHGLIVSGIVVGREQHQISVMNLRITAKGLDFIEKDGGLGALLNIVTVKIHEDTLAKIETFIALSSLSQTDKTGLLAQLKLLPSYAIEHLARDLVDLGLEQAKEALPLVQKYAAKALDYCGIGPTP